MIVLDASVLIGHFEPADAHHHDASALLKAHLSEPFAANVITLAEVYTGAARAGRSDRLQQVLAQLQIESMAIATFDDTLAALARDLGLTIATP